MPTSSYEKRMPTGIVALQTVGCGSGALYLLRDTGYPLAQSLRCVKFFVAYAWIERARDGGRS